MHINIPMNNCSGSPTMDTALEATTVAPTTDTKQKKSELINQKNLISLNMLHAYNLIPQFETNK